MLPPQPAPLPSWGPASWECPVGAQLGEMGRECGVPKDPHGGRAGATRHWHRALGSRSGAAIAGC